MLDTAECTLCMWTLLSNPSFQPCNEFIRYGLIVCVCSIAQSCPTLCNPMDCGLPDSSVHGMSQARILEWVVISLLQGIFPTQGSNPHFLSLLHWQADSLPLSHQGSPRYQYCPQLNEDGDKWENLRHGAVTQWIHEYKNERMLTYIKIPVIWSP